jgi:uncharacterized protein (TIGR03118 family)
MRLKKVLSWGVLAGLALVSEARPASAITGYKAWREVSDVTLAQFPNGFTQVYDKKMEMPWGLAADHNPCYVYGSLACHSLAPAYPVWPELSATDAITNLESVSGLKVLWVADNDSNYVTLYDDNGFPISSGGQALAIENPGGPTGIALNPYCEPVRTVTAGGVAYTSACDALVADGVHVPFAITDGAGHWAPAVWLSAGQDGRIYGWNPRINPTRAVVAYDNAANHASYTGLAISPDGHTLVLADFYNRRIDAFSDAFAAVTFSTGGAPSALVDPSLPAGYTPSNVAFISYPPPADYLPPQTFPSVDLGVHLYVTYGLQGPSWANVPEIVGPPAPTVYTGNYGLANDFTMSPGGSFTVRRLNAPADKLNAPWGVALAPANFGIDSSTSSQYLFYIGNFGDGYVNVFDAASGTYVGRLGENPVPIVPPASTVPGYPTVGIDPSTPPNKVIWIPGLRGLAFKKVAYQVAPVPLYFDWANRLFFNANLQFNSTDPASEWSEFGFIRPG